MTDGDISTAGLFGAVMGGLMWAISAGFEEHIPRKWIPLFAAIGAHSAVFSLYWFPFLGRCLEAWFK
jgi:hypothetical protein